MSKEIKAFFKKHSVRVYFQALGPLFLHFVCFSDGVFSHLSGCWIVFLNGHNGSAYFRLLVIQRCSSDLSCVQASAAASHTGETGPSSWGLLAGCDPVWCHIIRWEGLIYWPRESLRYSNGFQHKTWSLRPTHTWFLLTAGGSEHQEWKLLNEGVFSWLQPAGCFILWQLTVWWECVQRAHRSVWTITASSSVPQDNIQ